MRRMQSTYDDLVAERAEAQRLLDVQQEKINHLDGVIKHMFPDGRPETPKPQNGSTPEPAPTLDEPLVPYDGPEPSRAEIIRHVMKTADGPVTIETLALQLMHRQGSSAEPPRDLSFYRRKTGKFLNSKPREYKRVARGVYVYDPDPPQPSLVTDADEDHG